MELNSQCCVYYVDIIIYIKPHKFEYFNLTFITYVVYQMAPRSWKPDSDLGNDVDIKRTMQETQSIYKTYVCTSQQDTGNYGSYTQNERYFIILYQSIFRY